jgi:hypothetical protein
VNALQNLVQLQSAVYWCITTIGGREHPKLAELLMACITPASEYSGDNRVNGYTVVDMTLDDPLYLMLREAFTEDHRVWRHIRAT